MSVSCALPKHSQTLLPSARQFVHTSIYHQRYQVRFRGLSGTMHNNPNLLPSHAEECAMLDMDEGEGLQLKIYLRSHVTLSCTPTFIYPNTEHIFIHVIIHVTTISALLVMGGLVPRLGSKPIGAGQTAAHLYYIERLWHDFAISLLYRIPFNISVPFCPIGYLFMRMA